MATLSFQFLGEPELSFGSGNVSIDPKFGLSRFGPISGLNENVSVAIIGPEKEVGELARWLERCRSPIPGKTDSLHLDPHFPGFKRAFGTEITISRNWDILIPEIDLRLALSDPDPATRFRKVVNLYCERVEATADAQPHPRVILLALSQDLINRCGALHLKRRVRRATKSPKPEVARQLTLFDEDLETAEEDDTETREVYRNFRTLCANMSDTTLLDNLG